MQNTMTEMQGMIGPMMQQVQTELAAQIQAEESPGNDETVGNLMHTVGLAASRQKAP